MDATIGPLRRERLLNVRAWPIWALPRSLIIFIVTVVLAAAAAITVSAASLSVRTHDLMVFGLLLACNAATVELTRRASEPEGTVKDVYAIWELPVVVLLPPLYALLMPVVRFALLQLRVRRGSVYRRVFSAAAIGIAYGSASLVFRSLAHLALGPSPTPERNTSVWIVAVAACAVVQWAVNQAVILTAIKMSARETGVRKLLFGGESLHNDVTELCVAILATLAMAMSLLTLRIADRACSAAPRARNG